MVFRVLPGLNSKEDDVKFLGFSKNDGDGPSGARRSSKTFPEVHHEFRVLCGKQRIAANHSSGTRILEG